MTISTNSRFRIKTFCIFVTLLTISLALLAVSASAGKWEQITRLIGPQDGIAVADTDGRLLFSKNKDKMLVPASTFKIVTALAARHYLGDDHRFTTEFYQDKKGNLKIKGMGDPLLISEVLTDIGAQLSQRISSCQDIVPDDGYFGNVEIPGVSSSLNPYDAPNGALCVNFNTVNFRRSGGKYISAEPQTPLLPFVMGRIQATGLNKGRIVLSARNQETILYAGHLFRHFLKKAGIECLGGIKPGTVTADDTLIYRHTSPFDLDTVIQKLLKYSNNYMANQLFIQAGIADSGAPGTLKKGRQAARKYLAGSLNLPGVSVDEGSGISRKNRISAGQMLHALAEFLPHRSLLSRKGRDLYKTGHLKGIRTRAGYIESADGGVYRYAVFINTNGRATDPVMRRLLATLK